MKFIKKYSPFVLVIVISGCGGAGSLIWSSTAPVAEKRAYYDSMSTRELCSYWDYYWDYGRLRSFVKQSLQRRGMDPYYCYNPELDALKQIQDTLANQ